MSQFNTDILVLRTNHACLFFYVAVGLLRAIEQHSILWHDRKILTIM